MAELLSALAAATKSVCQRPTESLLIVLAIALGVAALTAVVAVVVVSQSSLLAFRDSASARMIDMGPNVQLFDPDMDARPAADKQVASPPIRLTYEDMLAAREASPTVDYGYVRGMRIMQWHEPFPFAMYSADYLAAARIQVVEGSLPTASDFEHERNVLLITPRYAARMGLDDPIGQEFTPFGGSDSYLIVGVIPDDVTRPISVGEAIVPFRTSVDPVSLVHFAVEDPDDLDQALLELEAFAQARWGDAIRVWSSRDAALQPLLEQRARGMGIAVFAIVSLAAAGFNIFGLMLARIARRQREIGVQRSPGATRATIGAQVLIEAGLLGVAGGVAGAVAGYWLLRTHNAFLSADIASFGVQIPFSLGTVAMGAVLAVVVSMFAASYPAVRATRINVVDALREV